MSLWLLLSSQQPLQVASVYYHTEEMSMHVDVYLCKCSCAYCMLSKHNVLDARSDPVHRLSAGATTAVDCALTAVAAVITFQLHSSCACVLQAPGRQQAAVCARAAGDHQPPPPLHAFCHTESAWYRIRPFMLLDKHNVNENQMHRIIACMAAVVMRSTASV